MRLSAEITLYPLQEDYRAIISAFLDELEGGPGIRRETYPTCTLLVGDYDEVMALISRMMKWSNETLGKSVFVVKFLPGYEAL